VKDRGCPRNCNRRAMRHPATGVERFWEGGRKAKTREPGDLPRVVVLFLAGVRQKPRGLFRCDGIGVVGAEERNGSGFSVEESAPVLEWRQG
jgi:hypothetical protein